MPVPQRPGLPPAFPAQTPLTGSLVLHGVQGDLNIVLTNGATICNGIFQPTAPCGASCYLDGPFTVAGGTGDFGRRNGGLGEATGGGTISLGVMNDNGPQNMGPIFGQPFLFLQVQGVVNFPPGVPCTVFTSCVVTINVQSTTAIIRSRLVQAAPVGILVERIVGKRFVRVGRVPFGRHHKGRVRILWNLRVNGHELPKGRYLITLRALDAHKHVISATRPVTITIR